MEIIGTYNPLTNPPQIRIDKEKAQVWIRKGAQPSDTVQRLLRQAGM